MLETLEFSLFVGLGVWQWLERRWWSWVFPASLLVGALVGNGWIVLWFGTFGLSVSRLLAALRLEATQNRNQIRTEVFLQRLRQNVSISRGGLTSALAAISLPAGIAPSEPTLMLNQLATIWDSEPLRRLGAIVDAARHHGGSLALVIDGLLARMRRDRRRRQSHRAEEAAQRSSVLVLGVVPIPIFVCFSWFAPEFHRVLQNSWSGHLAILWIAVSTFIANEILRWHVVER